MTSLTGWHSRSPIADAPFRLDRMFGSAAPSARWLGAGGQAAVATRTGVPPAHLVEFEEFVLGIVGHPRLTDGSPTNDLQTIARLVRDRGDAALSGIGGDFALAAWDSKRQRGLIATDRIGIQPMFYSTAGGALVFASSLDGLVSFPGVDTGLSPQAIYDYLYFHVCPGPGTIYRGARRLDAGHFIAFGRDGYETARPYWTMRFVEDRRRDFGELKSEFIQVVQEAVRSSAEESTCGTFLSGGTDSSTVTGMLGRASGHPARAFSIGFAAAGYDEMEYARLAARHFGAEHHEYYVTPADVVDALPRIAACYDQPFGNASAVPVYYCARFAGEHGITRLLAGDGGDELYGGNERYAKQHVLGLYHRLPAGLRHGLIEPVTARVPLFALPGLRKVRSYVQQASPAMPARYESYNLLNHLGPENVLDPEFLASVDRQHPQLLMQDAHAPYADCSLINQLLGIDLRFTLADSDLPKVSRMCTLAGVDVVYPLLDDRVVDFSAALAPDLKLRGTQLRWFFKEALRDFLPSEIIAKQKHGFGLPVGDWLNGHSPLRELAFGAIESLRPLGIVRPDFVEDLLLRKMQQHPRYFGTMAWVLAVLGLWLQQRRSLRLAS